MFLSVQRKHAKNSNNNFKGNTEWPVMMMYNITRGGCDCSSFESRMTISNWSASGSTSELSRISHPFDQFLARPVDNGASRNPGAISDPGYGS